MNNDRFKFRVFDKNYNDYLPEGVLLDGRTGDVAGTKYDGYVIEQCTGLKDKNDKLIYEADVVRFLWQLKDNEICKIIWDKNHCSFACVDIKNGAEFITWYSVFENGQSNRCEIISNIHEMEVTK